jgi:hypothetical protein
MGTARDGVPVTMQARGVNLALLRRVKVRLTALTGSAAQVRAWGGSGPGPGRV